MLECISTVQRGPKQHQVLTYAWVWSKVGECLYLEYELENIRQMLLVMQAATQTTATLKRKLLYEIALRPSDLQENCKMQM